MVDQHVTGGRRRATDRSGGLSCRQIALVGLWRHGAGDVPRGLLLGKQVLWGLLLVCLFVSKYVVHFFFIGAAAVVGKG